MKRLAINLLALAFGLYLGGVSVYAFAEVCATVDTNGFVIANLTPVEECTAYVLQEAGSWAGLWQMPDSSTLGKAWFAGFSLPMTVGMMAWAVSKLVNFWNK